MRYVFLAILLPVVILTPVRVHASLCAHGEQYDAAVVFLADASKSMRPAERALIKQGHAATLTSPDVLALIRQGTQRQIAVAYLNQVADYSLLRVPWMAIRNGADATYFATQLLGTKYYMSGDTALGLGLLSAWELLREVPCAQRQIIDIVGDGVSNYGLDPRVMRDRLAMAGIEVNGLVITTGGDNVHERPPGGLAAYYHKHVVTGFVVTTHHVTHFPEAFKKKFRWEVAGRQN